MCFTPGRTAKLTIRGPVVIHDRSLCGNLPELEREIRVDDAEVFRKNGLDARSSRHLAADTRNSYHGAAGGVT